MALTKQAFNLNFRKGLDTKSDPFQVPFGKFLGLQNSIFTKAGQLQKRNGFGALGTLPDTTSTLATTFNGALLAIGNQLRAYTSATASWSTKGTIQSVSLSGTPLVRAATNQTQADSAVAANGLVCTVFTDTGSGSTLYRYAILDSATGQSIVAPTNIPTNSGTITGSPRVFALGNYFVVVTSCITGGTNSLQYAAVSSAAPTALPTTGQISAQYTPAASVAFDGVVANNNLYLAWNGSDGGGAIRMTYLDTTLAQHNTVTFATRVATIMSVCADTSGSSPNVWAAFYDSATSTGYALCVNQALTTVLAPTQIISSGTVKNITAAAQNGTLTALYEVQNAYGYDSSVPTNLVKSITVTQAGSVGAAATVLRSVGLASKAFIVSGTIYALLAYSSPFQPTYFLSDTSGNICAKLAYSNGGGYLTAGLPSISLSGSTAQVCYLIKDLLAPANKTQGSTTPNPTYSQTGVNLAAFNLAPSVQTTAEIGNNLHLSGGFLWMYDGAAPVEHNFHVWPDSVEATTATTGGHLSAQIYFYVATYEWMDSQANIHRSAPSIPLKVDLSGSGTSTNTITVNVPTLRLTAKTASPVKIVLYRWSTAQQTYYQVTSLTSPKLNDLTVDSLAIVDTLADASILGNSILYTTGGVVEDIAAPACTDMALMGSRLFLIDAEDQNLLWYSKEVIESTPVEMSDLFTKYIPPTSGAQGSTGPMKCLAPMDDKKIIFKASAIYYFTGNGPDNTGANNDFSDPIFITGTVGTSNPQSIVQQPNGLMFQSDKGIWLLGRDLSTSYIGAPVESFTSTATVLSAINVPGTNQIRFTLSSGITLMYDYFFDEWGTFVNVPAISSTLYQGLHTFINSRGAVYQETPGAYLDGSSPVLMSFTTSWMNLAGLQGYERAYYFLLLGTYISPHKLSVAVAYNYSQSPAQVVTLSPDNFNSPYGGDTLYGGNPLYGGNSTVMPWRVFFSAQKCEAFQITISEQFDPSKGTAAGAGLTLSGLDLVVGLKKGYSPRQAARSTG